MCTEQNIHLRGLMNSHCWAVHVLCASVCVCLRRAGRKVLRDSAEEAKSRPSAGSGRARAMEQLFGLCSGWLPVGWCGEAAETRWNAIAILYVCFSVLLGFGRPREGFMRCLLYTYFVREKSMRGMHTCEVDSYVILLRFVELKCELVSRSISSPYIWYVVGFAL